MQTITTPEVRKDAVADSRFLEPDPPTLGDGKETARGPDFIAERSAMVVAPAGLQSAYRRELAAEVRPDRGVSVDVHGPG